VCRPDASIETTRSPNCVLADRGRRRTRLGRCPELSFPFNARGIGEPPVMGLPHPSSCAHRFSQPLGALLPPRPARACFIPIALLGFLPFRGFPPLEAARLSARRPLVMSGRSLHLQGFDPPADPCSHQAPVKVSDGRSSLELHPLQGVPPTCDGARVERVLPSCGLGSDPTANSRVEPFHFRVSFDRWIGLPLSSAADPPEVLVLVSPLVAWSCCFAGLMDSPWPPTRVSTNGPTALAQRQLASVR
jgi:hypothetical protein